MAREIIIRQSEVIDGLEHVECIFVYPTRYSVNNEKFALTPIDSLEAKDKKLFNFAETKKLNEGDLSWELIGKVIIPAGFSTQERLNKLTNLYRRHKEIFKETFEEPKALVEYIDVVDRP